MGSHHQAIDQFVQHAGYLGVYLLMVIGNLGIPTGTEFVVTLAGALTALHKIPGNAFTVGTVAMAGEISGGTVMYCVGYFGGRPLAEKYGHALRISKKTLGRVDAFFARHGKAAVFLARFLPLVRGIDALPAGVARMNPVAYFASTIAGSLLFCYGLASLGAAFAGQLEQVSGTVGRFGAFALLVPVLALTVVLIRRRRMA